MSQEQEEEEKKAVSKTADTRGQKVFRILLFQYESKELALDRNFCR